MGGITEEFATPLSESRGFRVRLDGQAVEQAFRIIASLIEVPADGSEGVQFTKVSETAGLPNMPHAVALSPGGTIAASTMFELAIESSVVPIANLIAIAFDNRTDGTLLFALNRFGDVTDVGTQNVTSRRLEWPAHTLGLNCFAVAGGELFNIDPVQGAIRSQIDLGWLPKEKWISIGAGRPGEIVLGSAAQRIVIANVLTQTIEADFPAFVFPSVRAYFGECSLVDAGQELVASLNPATLDVVFYDRNGTSRRVVSLAERFGLTGPFVSAIGLEGDEIAFAFRHTKNAIAYELILEKR